MYMAASRDEEGGCAGENIELVGHCAEIGDDVDGLAADHGSWLMLQRV